MSEKYLGKEFDIHGGGMDLMFPHHECEIAQHQAAHGTDPAKYWMHVNMLTINGQKMGKSLGNNISLKEFFSGSHPMLTQAYSPMTIRYFILQAQYRSTLDFSNEALQAARKGLRRLLNGIIIAKGMSYPEVESAINEKISKEIQDAINGCHESIADDLNTAAVIAHLFTLLKRMQAFSLAPSQALSISRELYDSMLATYQLFITGIFALKEDDTVNGEAVLDTLLELYAEAKGAKDYTKIDWIRAQLKAIGILVKDMKTGISWSWEE
jgi:cysteinyl-tRNA synthetase